MNGASASSTPRSGWDAQAWTSAFAEGRAEPRELMEKCLEQIARHDPELGICVHVADPDLLLDQAVAAGNRWRNGVPLSPLDGLPFGVKANIAVGGFPWHGGIAAFRQRRAPDDADCVSQLRTAGLIPLALCNMHEAALGETSDNPAFRTTVNPHDPTRIAGGSSGGSAAAVAAGMVPIALGTDDLGSVRLPSALCGVVGFKPARDEIPTGGVMPLCRRLDHVGVHGRSVADVVAVMRLFQKGTKPTLGSGVPAVAAGGVSGLVRWGFELPQPLYESIGAAFDRVLADHGVGRLLDWSDVDLSALRRAGLLVCERDAAEVFSRALREHPEGFSSTFKRLVEWGAAQPREKVRRAERLLVDMGRRLRTELGASLLLSPTTMHLAPRCGTSVPTTLADLTVPAAIAGIPAISVPMGQAGKGLPMGLQIAGLASADVLNAARLFFPGVAAGTVTALELGLL